MYERKINHRSCIIITHLCVYFFLFFTNLLPLQSCTLSSAMDYVGNPRLAVFIAAQMAAASPAAPHTSCFPSPLIVRKAFFPFQSYEIIEMEKKKRERKKTLLFIFYRKKGTHQGPLSVFLEQNQISDVVSICV